MHVPSRRPSRRRFGEARKQYSVLELELHPFVNADF